MIQRIQSVYLLVVTILLIVCLCLPIGSYAAADNSISDFYNLCIRLASGEINYAPWALFAILCASSALSFATIFLFKNRMLQIRLTIFNLILLIGYYITFVAFVFMLKDDNAAFSMSWPVCLPIIAVILDWLTIRAIGKDEVLVKAYDRLR